MANTKKNEIRYIDDKTAQVTKSFQKNACIFGTDEFKMWREYKAMIFMKSHKPPRKHKIQRRTADRNLKKIRPVTAQ